MRSYGEDGVIEAIRAAGGEVYAVTSEPHSLARSAEQEWETGFSHVGDPHHEIALDCAERGWLSLFSGEWFGDAVGIDPDWVSHPNGYFQPGVLVVSQQRQVLYRWRCRPTHQNVGGAIARPTPDHVWARTQAALAAGANAGDAPLDANPELDAPAAPWPLFLALLVANGRFVRPQAFNYHKDGPTVPARLARARNRLLLFVAAWIAAALLLPTALVALAFVAWAAWIAPKIARVHRAFQHVAPDAEPIIHARKGEVG